MAITAVRKAFSPIVDKALRWLVYRNGVSVVVNGERFVLDYYYRGLRAEYENAFYRAFVEDLRAGMTVLDIGAHVGLFGIAAARRVGDQGKVVCVEPAPAPRRFLQRHLRINQCQENCSVLACAVGAADGACALNILGGSTVASFSHDHVQRFRRWSPRETPETITVETVTLDTLCRKNGISPDVIKIDVEGAELDVLRGGRQFLSDRKPIVFCEVHPESQAHGSGRVEDVARELGFQVEQLSEPNAFGIYHVKLRR